jgi:RNA polymerase-binding transcription factor DksA
MNGLKRNDLLGLKRRLEQEMEDIRRVLAEECSPCAEGPGVYGEQADAEAHAGALNMGNAAVVRACVAAVEAIDRSMLAIEAGKYGSCGACGEPIGVHRLRQVPTTTLCVDCAERAAQGNLTH